MYLSAGSEIMAITFMFIRTEGRFSSLIWTSKNPFRAHRHEDY